MVTYVTVTFYIIICHKEGYRRFWNNIRVKDSKLYFFLFLFSFLFFILFIFLFLNLELEVSVISHMTVTTVTHQVTYVTCYSHISHNYVLYKKFQNNNIILHINSI